ncbi:MAG: internalization-related competence protein ComEC/Rec2 protein [Parcubacteria group bacterium GW2011_GWC2_40_31]|nr:MAG: internalization-related competence protein ComEC/Rec2 protein [Parcubacteria group bacterium GW2011_GWF2_40_10]KKR47456.1 MAG: internalization-related competence protein ComEC/Rec2 protein [Parcubacteria group bacterium GW2011_GWA2_40_143]KKR59877.1 MAG: internalization-related competence protein ComEC/Rec2 protein [Parcubacteria group bacterium GW2011_GWC2_40_31]KKR76117.1 MAG: internalization-related competence protein ComEC/Rec2 protein [Parcubacteria group bacterium GW2011_GWE2_40_8]
MILFRNSKYMQQKFSVVILSGFVSGVFISSFISFGEAFASLFIFLGAVFFFLHGMKIGKLFLIVSLIFASFGFGILRYEYADKTPASYGELEKMAGGKADITGVVIDEPSKKSNYTELAVKTGDLIILVYANHYPKFNYGDKITLKGTLEKPENFNESFDWKKYLAKSGIYFEMFYPEAELVSSGNGHWLKKRLFSFKENFLSAIAGVISEPHAAFLGGLTVGARDAIPNSLKEDFNTTGMTHIVALSGYNVTIIADNIMRAFSFLPRMFGMGAGSLGIAFFAIMTGASATTVRASVMALMAVLAGATGRIYAVTWALFLAGFFMILQNPKILRFDTSFQLSFAATLGLIYISPIMSKKLWFMPKKFKIRETISATLSAQVAVLPLIVYKIGSVSLLSLFVNLLVLPFIPITMFFGFLTGAIGMFSAFLSVPLGWISYVFLQYELYVIKSFAKIPYASVAASGFSEIFLILSYAIIFLAILHLHKKEKLAEQES